MDRGSISLAARLGLAFLGVGLITAASPFPQPTLLSVLPAQPEPRVARQLADSGLAPVPNLALAAPIPTVAKGPAQPEFAPRLFAAQKTYRGEGFVTGSTPQIAQDRRQAPAVGFNLRLPLE